MLESKPYKSGQLFDPHLWPSLHWWLKSQSPSLKVHDCLHAQYPMSPIFTVVHLTENEFCQQNIDVYEIVKL